MKPGLSPGNSCWAPAVLCAGRGGEPSLKGMQSRFGTWICPHLFLIGSILWLESCVGCGGMCVCFFPLIWCKEKCCKATIQITPGGKSVKENTAWGISGIRIAVSSFDSQRVLLSAEQYLNIGSFHCISEYSLIL